MRKAMKTEKEMRKEGGKREEGRYLHILTHECAHADLVCCFEWGGAWGGG